MAPPSIVSVRVENFRAVVDRTLELGSLTALIGANGSGKTTLLLALERFFADRQKLMEAGDFKGKSQLVRITVAFRDAESGEVFEVAREWKRKGDTVEAPKYSWGKKTSAACKKYLEENVDVIYVPAEHVTDDDGEDKRNSLWEKIINAAVRKRVKLDDDIDSLHDRIRKKYTAQLRDIEKRINDKMSGEGGVGYAPNTRAIMEFSRPAVTTGVDLRMRDLNSSESVRHKYAGHGTKRAFYMSALEALSEIPDDRPEDAGEAEKRQEHLTVIVIDEPELHQHPQRQKVLLEALRGLSGKASHQVVYSTHSPHFVRLKEPMSVRKVWQAPGGVRICNGADLARAQVRGAVIGAMEEAVFANGVVLVEGYTDVVALDAIFRGVTHRVDGKDQSVMETLIKGEVAIAECGGKPNVTRFCDVLDSLGIKKFVVWDGDGHHTEKKKKAETRERNVEIVEKLGLDPGFLERIEGAGEGGCAIGEGCACFGFDGATYLAGCFGKRHKDELEAAIKGGKSLDGVLDLAALEGTAFFREAVPAILARLAKRSNG
ncbi:MAG: AAA family ATPase [Thaumarchaeota archaeon]|nr:AAA family ATPase [Nitrososphaerota archaeon]